MMIPGILTFVPSFMLVKSLHLLNTRAVLVLPAIASGQVLSIFILTTFMQAMPEELFEAARIDGARILQSFRYIALPMSRDVLFTIGIIIIINNWNSFLWPLITVNSERLKVISVGLRRFAGGFFLSPQYGPMFAGYVLASLPLFILFLASGRYYIRGITSGALKF
jgi:ABC-type glycerol-3-phosphate transport system permease component